MSNPLIPIMTMLTALAPGSEPSAPCNESIRQQDLKADLYFLAGDAFQGRLTGTAGNDLGRRVHRLSLRTPWPEASRATTDRTSSGSACRRRRSARRTALK